MSFLSLVVARRLQGTWALQLRQVGSVVVARGLSCPAACGILVPRPEIEPASSALEGGFFTTGPPGESQRILSHFCLGLILAPSQLGEFVFTCLKDEKLKTTGVKSFVSPGLLQTQF